jgi:hypothetical protein
MMRGYVCKCWRLTHQFFGARGHPDYSGMEPLKNARVLLANPQVPKLVCPTCLLGRRKSLVVYPLAADNCLMPQTR